MIFTIKVGIVFPIATDLSPQLEITPHLPLERLIINGLAGYFQPPAGVALVGVQ